MNYWLMNVRDAAHITDHGVTAKEIAKQYETTVAYVYKLACIHHWNRTRKRGRIHYDVLEVARILGDE